VSWADSRGRTVLLRAVPVTATVEFSPILLAVFGVE
jgi:hypothetical protein